MPWGRPPSAPSPLVAAAGAPPRTGSCGGRRAARLARVAGALAPGVRPGGAALAAVAAVAATGRPRGRRRGLAWRCGPSGGDSRNEIRELEALARAKRRGWFGIRWRALEQDLEEALEAERRVGADLRAKIGSKEADVSARVGKLRRQLDRFSDREAALVARLRAVETGMAAGAQRAPAPPDGARAPAREAEAPTPGPKADRQTAAEDDSDAKWARTMEEQNATLVQVLGVIERLERQSTEPLAGDGEQSRDELERASVSDVEPPAHPPADAEEAPAEGGPADAPAQQRRAAKDLVMKGYRNAWGR
uniref:Uncharacterized protein n=1 Tax=Alexandrium monilatum TaxID=311494 RepID=A0A7S4SF31_9DINO